MWQFFRQNDTFCDIYNFFSQVILQLQIHGIILVFDFTKFFLKLSQNFLSSSFSWNHLRKTIFKWFDEIFVKNPKLDHKTSASFLCEIAQTYLMNWDSIFFWVNVLFYFCTQERKIASWEFTVNLQENGKKRFCNESISFLSDNVCGW